MAFCPGCMMSAFEKLACDDVALTCWSLQLPFRVTFVSVHEAFQHCCALREEPTRHTLMIFVFVRTVVQLAPAAPSSQIPPGASFAMAWNGHRDVNLPRSTWHRAGEFLAEFGDWLGALGFQTWTVQKEPGDTYRRSGFTQHWKAPRPRSLRCSSDARTLPG